MSQRALPLFLAGMLLVPVLLPLAPTAIASATSGEFTIDMTASVDFAGDVRHDNATFGAKTGATSGYDEKIDHPEPPAVPTPPALQAFFRYANADPNLQKLTTSIIAPGDNLTWPLVVFAKWDDGTTERTGTLSWSTDTVNTTAPGSLVELVDGCMVVPMNTRSSHTFALPAFDPSAPTKSAERIFTVRVVSADGPMANLSISRQDTFVSDVVTLGGSLKAGVTLRNDGTIPASCVEVDLIIDGKPAQAKTLGGLPVGGTTSFTFDPVLFDDRAALGAHKAEIVVWTSAAEGNHTDNRFVQTFNVAEFLPELTRLGPDTRVTGPGLPVTFQLEVRNGGTHDDEFNLVATQTPQGWTLAAPTSVASLAPGASTTIDVVVTPPTGKLATALLERFDLVASSVTDPTRTATASFNVSVENFSEGTFVNVPAAPIKAGPLPVRIEFTKPMNTTVLPSVSLVAASGSAVVVSGSYTDADTYEGTASISAGMDGLFHLQTSGGRDTKDLAAIGNVSAAFLVDTQLPEIHVRLTGTEGDDDWYRSSVLVNLSHSDATPVDLEFSIGGASFESYVDEFSLTDGVRDLAVRVTDAAGNVNATTLQVKVDATRPITNHTLTGTLNKTTGWYVSPVTVNLEDRFDATSGIGRTNYSLDGSAPTVPYTGPFTVGTQGPLELRYATVDVAGNEEFTRIVGFRIDTVAPEAMISLDQAPGATGWITSPVNVTVSAKEETSGVAGIFYNLDTGLFRSYGSRVLITTQGATVFSAYVVDGAGNQSVVNTTAFRIDSAAPATTLKAKGPSVGTNLYSGTVVLNLTATDGSGDVSGVRQILYRLDASASWETYTENVTIAASTGSSTHTIEYRSVDEAGNDEAARSLSFTIDPALAQPDIELNGPGGPTWFRGDVEVTLKSPGGTIQYSLDGGAELTYAAPFVVTKRGTTVLAFRTVNDGVPGPVVTRDVQIDDIAPVSTNATTGDFVRASGLWRGPVTVSLTATDAHSGLSPPGGIWVSVDGGSGQFYTGPFAVTGDGAHVVRYNASDVAGNEEAPVNQLALTIDTTPPTIAFAGSPPTQIRQFETPIIAVAVADAHPVRVTVNLTHADGTFRVIPATDLDRDGVYEAQLLKSDTAVIEIARYYAEASDSAGHTARTSSVSLATELRIGDGIPPSVNFLPPAPGQPIPTSLRGSASIRVQADDNVGVAAIYLNATRNGVLVESLEGTIVSTSASGTTYTFAWDTTTALNGPYQLELIALDAAGNVGTTQPLSIKVENPPLFGPPKVFPPIVYGKDRSPKAGDNIHVESQVTGTTTPLTVSLTFTTGAPPGTSIGASSITSDGFHNFSLGQFSPGMVRYYMTAVDAAGVAARFPSSAVSNNQQWAFIPIAPPVNVNAWGSAAKVAGGGSGTNVADHPAAQIENSAYMVLNSNSADDRVYLGMSVAAPFDYARPALYIVEFDLERDGTYDYNLTATHTVPGGEWSYAWNAAGGNSAPSSWPATDFTYDDQSAKGSLRFEVSLAGLADLLAAHADPRVRFRTVGSEDLTSAIAIDVAAPQIVLAALGNVKDDQDVLISATVTDVSLQSVDLQYSVNGASFVSAAAASQVGTTFTWTIPRTVLAAGELRYFVTAIDTTGNTASTAVQTVTVASATPPTGTVQALRETEEDTAVVFAATDLSANSVSFAWDFGDGTTAFGSQVTHVYADPGDYNVTLTVGDPWGTTINATHAISVRDVTPPAVAFVSPANGVYLKADVSPITLRASDFSGVNAVRVSFDDGMTFQPALRVGTTDDYTIDWDRSALAGRLETFVLRAEAADLGGLIGTAPATTVTVDGVLPVADAGADLNTTVGTLLTFAGIGTDNVPTGLRLDWDFDDGTSAQGATAAKTYATAGTYTVALTVTDAAGNVAVDKAIVTVALPTSDGTVGDGGGGGSGGSSGTTTPTPPVVQPCPTGQTLVESVCIAKPTTCPAGETLVDGACAVAAAPCPAGQIRVADACQAIVVPDPAPAPQRQKAENITAIALPEAFGDVNGTFVDENDALEAPLTSTLNGSALHIVRLKGAARPSFLYDAGAKVVIPLDLPNASAAAPVRDPATGEDRVMVTVEKGTWIYFEIPDALPGQRLSAVLNATGHPLPADRVWREGGRVAVLDDPTTTYTVVYAAAGSADVAKPTISFLALPSTLTAGDNLVVEVLATDDSGQVLVELFVGGKKVGERSTSPYRFVVPTGALAEGDVEVLAVATDAAGNTAEVSRLVGVRSPCPPKCPGQAAITLPDGLDPTDGKLVIAPIITGAIGTVQYYLNGELVGESPTGVFELDTTALAPGKYTLRAVVIGPDGSTQSEDETEFEVSAADQDEAEGKPVSPWLIAVLVAVAILGLVGALVYLRKKD